MLTLRELGDRLADELDNQAYTPDEITEVCMHMVVRASHKAPMHDRARIYKVMAECGSALMAIYEVPK